MLEFTRRTYISIRKYVSFHLFGFFNKSFTCRMNCEKSIRGKKISHSPSVSPLQWVRRIDATTTRSLCARPTTAAFLSGPSATARTTAGTTAMSRAAVSLLLFQRPPKVQKCYWSCGRTDRQVSLCDEIISSPFTNMSTTVNIALKNVLNTKLQK